MTENTNYELGKEELTSMKGKKLFVHVEPEEGSCLKGEKGRLFSHVNTGETLAKIPHQVLGRVTPPRLFTDVSKEATIPLSSFDVKNVLEKESIGSGAGKDIPTQMSLVPSKGSHLFTNVNSEGSTSTSISEVHGILEKQSAIDEAVDKKGDSKPIAITEGRGKYSQDWKNFDLRLEQAICEIHDVPYGEKSIFYYRFQIRVGSEVFDALVNANEVGKFKWVQEAAHGKACIKKGRTEVSFEEYISTILIERNVVEKMQYITNGWKKTRFGDWVYVLGDGCIGNLYHNIGGNKNAVFEYDRNSVGSERMFREAMGMLDICEDKALTVPLFLFTHAGVLTNIFEQAGCPIKFLMAVIGETNSRKTSLSLCMTKLFNRREIQKPEVTFNSTGCGIEKMVGLNPDSVLVIDDFMPAQTKAKQNNLDEKSEKMVRMYGERKSIERMNDFAKKPDAGYYPIRNIAVVTGEHMTGVQSSLTRSLILKITKDSVQNPRLSYYQRNFQILNNHIYDFIQYISINQKEVLEYISPRVEEYRRQSQLDPPRYSEMYAIMMTITDLILSYAAKRQFMSEVQCKEVYEKWNSIMLHVLRSNISELHEKNLVSNISQVLQALVENGRICPLLKEEQKNYGDLIFEDAEYIFIRLDTLLKEMRLHLTLWGFEAPNLTKPLILNELENAGLIETKGKSEGKRTLKLPDSKVNGQRYLYVRKDKIMGGSNELKKVIRTYLIVGYKIKQMKIQGLFS